MSDKPITEVQKELVNQINERTKSSLAGLDMVHKFIFEKTLQFNEFNVKNYAGMSPQLKEISNGIRFKQVGMSETSDNPIEEFEEIKSRLDGKPNQGTEAWEEA